MQTSELIDRDKQRRENPVRNSKEAPNRQRFAALDLGTNNCRLLIAEACPDGFEVVDSFSRITRLGEGLAATNRLGEAAMSRTLTALKVCRRIMDRNGIDSGRYVATEACRRADNGASFIERVRRTAGIQLEILGAEAEAHLAMLGCLPLIDPDADELMMIDIGGGSTEVMWIDRRHNGEMPKISLSLPMGVVTLSETFGKEPTLDDYRRMVELVRVLLRKHCLASDAPPPLNGARVQMLGTSGTVTTLAAVHLGLRRYDRRKVDGIRLPFESISNVAGQLRALANDDRASHPCIGNGRADLVIAGCAILDAVHENWPVPWLKVADRGVREGILNDLMGRTLDHAAMSGRPN